MISPRATTEEIIQKLVKKSVKKFKCYIIKYSLNVKENIKEEEKSKKDIRHRKEKVKLGAVAHTCNPSTLEAEVGGS